MDLDLRHLRLVAAVAQHQSLTRAGEALHLTQSALSHQLRDIEDRLGARLFQRLNRKMIPTPAGQRLLASAERVLPELQAAEAAIRSGLRPEPVTLRIATECYTCYHWLPSVLKPFHARFPDVSVRIDPSATSNPIAKMLDGGLDLAIVSSAIRHRQLAVAPLFKDEHVLVMAPNHPLAGQSVVRLSDFRDQRLLVYSSREESHFVTRVLQPAGILPATVESVKLTEAALELVRAGLGVAVLARWAVEPYVRRGTLAVARITARGWIKEWRAVMPRRLADADYVAEFTRLVIAAAPPAAERSPVPFRRNRDMRATG